MRTLLPNRENDRLRHRNKTVNRQLVIVAYYLDAASKSCIGLHRCTVRNDQPWNPQYHRRGLLKADDTPYRILTETALRGR